MGTHFGSLKIRPLSIEGHAVGSAEKPNVAQVAVGSVRTGRALMVEERPTLSGFGAGVYTFAGGLENVALIFSHGLSAQGDQWQYFNARAASIRTMCKLRRAYCTTSIALASAAWINVCSRLFSLLESSAPG